MRQISGGDALFLYSDKQSRHQHISMLYVYDQSERRDGPLRFKDILRHVEARVGSSPVFRQRLVEVPLNLDYPYWINDPDFDLEFHVRHIALPKPGDWRQLCIQLSRLHARPLDMSRPVWEMYVIEGLDNVDFLPEGSFAIMTKIHHVAIDGVAAAQLTEGLHDTEPCPKTQPRQKRWRPEPEPDTARLLARAVRNNLRTSLGTGRKMLDRLQGRMSAAFGGEGDKPWTSEPGPPTRFNQPISPHRVWDAARFDLADFKAIKNAVPGATINDVVLTVCGGAMQRYLSDKNELPERSLAALVPVSVRTHEESGAAGNKVHLTRTSLKTRQQNPLERLAEVSEEMRHVKAMNALGAREMTELQEGLPAPTMLLAARATIANTGPGRRFREQNNMIVTNVPGPQHTLYFRGARLVMFTGLAVITDYLGISHAVTSYDGTLVIAPLADRAMMPDPEFYAECLRAEFAALAAASKPTKARRKGGRRQGPSTGLSAIRLAEPRQ